MTALPAITSLIDPAPSVRAPESTNPSNSHFFSLMQNGQNSHAPSTKVVGAQASGPNSETAAPPPTSAAKTGEESKTGGTDGHDKSAKKGDSASIGAAVVVPLPVPVVLTQPPPSTTGSANPAPTTSGA